VTRVRGGGLAAIGGAVAIALALTAWQSGAQTRGGAQTGAESAAGAGRACPNTRDSADFHACAIGKMETFAPALTPWGVPDLRGMWAAPAARGQDIEEIDEKKAFLYGGFGSINKSIVVDPPDGKIPYQPWAMAQRWKNVEAFLSQGAACMPVPVQRWVYSPVQVTGHRVFQRPDQIVFSMERQHTYRIVPLDGRPHIPPVIRLWRGDTRGRWEGHSLVMVTTNRNDFGWWDHQGTMSSEETTMEERLTFVDENTIHYQARFEDPKLFTRPWTMVMALSRLSPVGIDFTDLEDTSVENCELELPHMLELGQRPFPGTKALAPK